MKGLVLLVMTGWTTGSGYLALNGGGFLTCVGAVVFLGITIACVRTKF